MEEMSVEEFKVYLALFDFELFSDIKVEQNSGVYRLLSISNRQSIFYPNMNMDYFSYWYLSDDLAWKALQKYYFEPQSHFHYKKFKFNGLSYITK
jgi:hypothetical protein